MLDFAYPSWSALIANLREIRAYLRSGQSSLPDKPEQYSFSRVRRDFEEQVRFVDGQPTIVLVYSR